MEHGSAEESRYRIDGTVGKGGMGTVYRAYDQSRGRHVALKRLNAARTRRAERLRALFQREYHTLAQLSHPSVIDVYDFGVDSEGPYYTMELLEGQDLYQQAPMPYRRACALLHGVASSLSLLHSRRLVHRDVSSRNIRIISEDQAKLIDFGAVAPMGPHEEVVGAAMYVPPEALLAQTLDGRCDLYSLGVALYHVLTRRFPYRARHIKDLRDAWQRPPLPLRELAPEVPLELERLTMSLIALDRTARPRDAAEVMERLAAIGELSRPEPDAASHAYLTAPTLVEREVSLARIREALVGTMRAGVSGLLLTGPDGVGRSRMLEACTLEARVLGAVVLSSGAKRAHAGPFAVAQALVEQLREAIPGLVEPFEEALDAREQGRAAMIAVLRELFRRAASRRALVIAIDDIDKLDEASVAAIVSLLYDAEADRIVVLSTLSSEVELPGALAYRKLVDRSERLTLAPLGPSGVRALLRTVFGNVPNVESVAERLHRLSRGRPRDVLALCEHLVARGVIRYRGGAWVVPEALSGDALPESMADAFRALVGALSPLTRRLAQAHALSALPGLTFEAYARLCPELSSHQIYCALDELLASDVFITDGHGYRFRHEGWSAALRAGLTEAACRDHHLALAAMHERGRAEPLSIAYHRMLGGDERGALSLLETFALEYTDQAIDIFDKTELGNAELCELFNRAVGAMDDVGASERLRSRLVYFVVAMGVFVDSSFFTRFASVVTERLKEAAGYTIWEALDPTMDPLARILEALKQAQARYDGMPEHERAIAPAEAIKLLVQFAVAAVAVGVRGFDGKLLRSLPALLEPFAPLTPIVETVWHNMYAAADFSTARFERSRERYREVIERLSHVDVAALEHADEIRDAVFFALATLELRLGIPTDARALDRPGENARHRSGVLRALAVGCLQSGDWEGARRYKQRAEQADMESDERQIFGSSLTGVELELRARGLDLGAVKQLRESIDELAAEYPGWVPYAHVARAEENRLRGDLEGALAEFRAALSGLGGLSAAPDHDHSWYYAVAGEMEVLIELARTTEARERGLAALAEHGDDLEGVRLEGVMRALALSEARLLDFTSARARLEALIAHRHALETRGFALGLLYETGAWIALWEHDDAEFQRFAKLAGEQYLAQRDSGYAGRYQRLVDAGRRAALPGVDDDLSLTTVVTAASGRRSPSLGKWLDQTLSACSDRARRAQRGLEVLCEQASAEEGHLFLLREGGLVLAASIGEQPAQVALQEFVAHRLRGEIEAFDCETTVDKAPPAEDSDAGAAVWVGPEGERFSVVMIEARMGAERVVVGAAVLRRAPDAHESSLPRDLGGMLGTFFLKAGDAVSDLASVIQTR